MLKEIVYFLHLIGMQSIQGLGLSRQELIVPRLSFFNAFDICLEFIRCFYEITDTFMDRAGQQLRIRRS